MTEYNAPYGGYEPSDYIKTGWDWTAAGYAYLLLSLMWADDYQDANTALRIAERNFARADRFYRAYGYKGGSQLQEAGCWIDPGY